MELHGFVQDLIFLNILNAKFQIFIYFLDANGIQTITFYFESYYGGKMIHTQTCQIVTEVCYFYWIQQILRSKILNDYKNISLETHNRLSPGWKQVQFILTNISQILISYWKHSKKKSGSIIRLFNRVNNDHWLLQNKLNK